MFGKQLVNSEYLISEEKRIYRMLDVVVDELQLLHDRQLEYGVHLKSKLKTLSDELTIVETNRAEVTKTINNLNKIVNGRII